MHSVLCELQPILDQMAATSDKLSKRASQPRQQGLNTDLTDLQKRLRKTTHLMGDKVNLEVLKNVYQLI